MRNESAGGLKVKALGQTLRDAGSSPAQHSNFSCSIKIALEKILFSHKLNCVSSLTKGVHNQTALGVKAG